MSSAPSLSATTAGFATAPAPAKPRARGFLHIVRHGAGPGSIYVLTYHRLQHVEGDATHPKPVLAEDARTLIELLERIGVDFKLAEVRGALEDILRLGSANIPDLWLSDEDLLAKGLAES